MDYKELYRKAAEVMPNAYAPFSKFNVGAALLTKTGKSLPVSTWKILLTALRSVPSGQLASKPSRRGFRAFEALAVASSGGTAYPLRHLQTISLRICTGS